MTKHTWEVLFRCSKVPLRRGAFWYERLDHSKSGRWWLGNGDDIKLHSTAYLLPKDLNEVHKLGFVEHYGGCYRLTVEGRERVREHFKGRRL